MKVYWKLNSKVINGIKEFNYRTIVKIEPCCDRVPVDVDIYRIGYLRGEMILITHTCFSKEGSNKQSTISKFCSMCGKRITFHQLIKSEELDVESLKKSIYDFSNSTHRSIEKLLTPNPGYTVSVPSLSAKNKIHKEIDQALDNLFNPVTEDYCNKYPDDVACQCLYPPAGSRTAVTNLEKQLGSRACWYEPCLNPYMKYRLPENYVQDKENCPTDACRVQTNVLSLFKIA